MKLKIMLPKSLLAASATGLLALAAVLPARADYSNTVMSLKPVGYWRLNEPAGPPVNYGNATATNSGSVGAAGNATYYHSPTTQVSGILTNDTAALFDGVSQYAEVPYCAGLNPTGAFTAEFWCNMTISVYPATSALCSRGTGYGNFGGYLFYVNNANTVWQFRVYKGGGSTVTDTAGPSILSNTWYHVVGVYDGTNISIYVNGARHNEPVPANYGANTNAAAAPFRIGANGPAAPASLFPGTLDEVAIYPTNLTAEVIAAHYDAGIAGDAAAYRALVLASNPSGYWRLDEPVVPPPPPVTPVTVTNRGSWGAGANGLFLPTPTFNTGVPGVPYPGFGGNTACKFPGGAGSSIQIPPQNLSTDSFTITCWTILPGTSQGGWSWLFSSPAPLPWFTGALPYETGLGFPAGPGSGGVANNSLSIWWVGATGSASGYGAGTTPTLYEPSQQWTFMAMVASTNDIVVYVNDQTASHTPGTATYGPHDFNLTNLFIGDNIVGSIAEMAVFDQALTPEQITQLYTAAAIPPIFQQKPRPLQLYAGATATFSTVMLGSPPLSYQWSFNNTPITGATSASYVVNQVGAGDVGNYSVQVTSPYGTTNSGNVALTLLPVSGAYAAEVVASAPVAYWRFNEGSGATAFDYCGGFNGTNVSLVYTNPGPLPSSSPTAYVGFETTNKTYTFNGTSSEVRVPTSFALNRGAFSIVSWIRADVSTPSLAIIAQGASTWRLELDANGSALQFVTTGLSGGNTLAGGTIVVDGSWHQAVAVYDGTNKYIYVDGYTLDAIASATGLETLDGSQVTIGSRGGAVNDFAGDIDEVAVYNRGLSADEVANLYRQATSAPGAPQILTEPVSQTVIAGQSAAVSVAAAGGAPYTYQWKHAGTNMPGATKGVLSFPSVWYTDAGTYSVAVNNSVGPITNSQNVSLTVTPPPTLATNMLMMVPPSANNGQSLELIWQAGTLMQSTNVTGPYTNVSGATAPYYKVTPGPGSRFYRFQL